MGHLAEYRFIFRENMQIYLQALNECIFKRYGNIRVDMLMAGGSALIIGHNFRNSTEDMDVYIRSQVDITPAINDVADMYSLPEDWLNSDFTKTKSFSRKLTDKADFVVSYGCLSVYKVCDLDLICMKLVSYREKDDIDLRGLLADCPGINQYIVSQELAYLYGKEAVYELKEEAKRFVRYNIAVR